MKEVILRDFFMGTASGSVLAQDIEGSVRKTSKITSVVTIRDMETDFEVTRGMLVSLCDAAIDGQVAADHLHVIGFALQASDKFHWDTDKDELVSEIISDWSCPEVNYPLTLKNIQRCRAWLRREEQYPARPTQEGTSTDGQIISIWKKQGKHSLLERVRNTAVKLWRHTT